MHEFRGSREESQARGSGAGGALIPAAYLLSGFCALIYENVWIHDFSLVFGSTVHALAVVVAVFLGGLAMGSRLFARLSIRTLRPVRLYGWLEIGIGLYALVVPALVSASDALYARLPAVTSVLGAASLPALTLARIGVAAAVLLLPTVLMGGTLPILVRHMVTHLDRSARGPGLLYGVNAVGAALGSFAAGYLLLEHLGVAGTNGVAAGLNIGIGIVALLLSARTPPVPAAAQQVRSNRSTQTASSTVALATICFALSGFVSMAYQVIFLRHLTFFLQDTIHLYSGIITVFVSGIGIGSLAGARLPWLERSPVAAFGWLQAGIGVTTIGALFAPVLVVQPLVGLRDMGGFPVLLVMAALLGMPTLMMGAIFPAVARIVIREAALAGESVGRAYAWNTAGSIAGTLTAGFILFPWLGLQTALVLLFALNMMVAATLLRTHAGNWRRAAVLPLALLVSFPLGTALLPGIRLPRALLERLMGPGGRIVDVREGITGTTWVVRSGEDDVSLLENGVVIGRRGRGSWVVAGFVPLLIAEDIPRRVLALAFGAGLSTLPARLFDEVEQLDLVDISRDNMEAALAHIPENRDLSADPRVRLLVDDAYSYLKRTPERYQHIFVEPTPPMFSFRNASLYSREFYALARDHLPEEGTFAQVLPLRQLSPHEIWSIMRTFAAVFPHRLLWWNHLDAVMVGCASPFHLDADRIARRINRPAVQAALKHYSPVGQYEFHGQFLAGLLLDSADFAAMAARGNIYTDDRLGLKFSTGMETGFAGIDTLHTSLTPWPQLQRTFPGLVQPDLPGPELATRREELMVLCYRSDPQRFTAAYLRYVELYSRRKKEDLDILIRYLDERGLQAEAARIREQKRQIR